MNCSSDQDIPFIGNKRIGNFILAKKEKKKIKKILKVQSNYTRKTFVSSCFRIKTSQNVPNGLRVLL